MATQANRTYFAGIQWWIARDTPQDPDGLVVAAKGGHNDEAHNQNDCGSVVLHWKGESLITDLGKPPDGYPVGYFDADRYERFLVARSLGHSVPLVNGCEQAPGIDRAATVRDREESESQESITIELGDCYPPEAGVNTLTRSLTLDRGDPGTVSISDRVTFSDETRANSATSVLVSYYPMTAGDESLIIHGDTGVATVEVPTEVTIEHLTEAVADRDVWRARMPLREVDETTAAIDLACDVAAANEDGTGGTA